MQYIIALFLATTILVAKDSNPQLLKSIVSGGNGNATLGQVVAGYKNGFHIGVRIPKRVALSVEETNVNSMLVYPNPTKDGLVSFGIDNIEKVHVTDVYGKVVTESIDFGSNTITLPNRGVFFIRITTSDKQDHSTKVIFN
jgi:Secretion system C-terminal sorting domain